MNNITLTDVEKWISQYPDLWDVYCEIQSKNYMWYQDTLSMEFQVLSQLVETFWKLAEINLKSQGMADDSEKE